MSGVQNCTAPPGALPPGHLAHQTLALNLLGLFSSNASLSSDSFFHIYAIGLHTNRGFAMGPWETRGEPLQEKSCQNPGGSEPRGKCRSRTGQGKNSQRAEGRGRWCGGWMWAEWRVLLHFDLKDEKPERAYRRLVVCAQPCPALCTPWTVAHQAPLSTGFSRVQSVPSSHLAHSLWCGGCHHADPTDEATKLRKACSRHMWNLPWDTAFRSYWNKCSGTHTHTNLYNIACGVSPEGAGHSERHEVM